MSATGIPKRLRDIVDRRADGSCEVCGRLLDTYGFQFSRHHRRPRMMGGSTNPKINSAANLIVICGTATSPEGCHLFIEKNRTMAYAENFLLRDIQEPSEAPFKYRGRLALLDDRGGIKFLDDGRG